jgi:hypothetical protein
MTKDEEFIYGYMECALWSSADDKDNPLDSQFSIGDLPQETRERMEKDCLAFIEKCRSENLNPFPEYANFKECSDAAYSGHDFWLTRNGHGAGYWDGDLPDPLGEQLTAIADTFPHCDLYVGDDGKLYIM